jgi:hypothetical protein
VHERAGTVLGAADRREDAWSVSNGRDQSVTISSFSFAAAFERNCQHMRLNEEERTELRRLFQDCYKHAETNAIEEALKRGYPKMTSDTDDDALGCTILVLFIFDVVGVVRS